MDTVTRVVLSRVVPREIRVEKVSSRKVEIREPDFGEFPKGGQRETRGKPTPWMHTLSRRDINWDSVPMARWMAGAGARIYQLDRQLAQKSSFDLLAPVQLATFFRAPLLLVNTNPSEFSFFARAEGRFYPPWKKSRNENREGAISCFEVKKKKTRGKTKTENRRLGSI